MKPYPREFSGGPGEDVVAWVKHADRVMAANKWDDEVTAAQISLVLKGEAEIRYQSYEDTVVATWSTLKKQMLDDYIMPRNEAKKKLGELKMTKSVLEYREEFNKLMSAAFPDLTEDGNKELWADYFVEGLIPEMRNYVQLHLGETSVTDIIKTLEPLEKKKVFVTKQDDNPDVNMVTEVEALKEEVKRLKLKQAEEETVNQTRDTLAQKLCFKCNKPGHFARECFPIRRGSFMNRSGNSGYSRRGSSSRQQQQSENVTCFNCQGRGHMARQCPSPRLQKNNPLNYKVPN